jgi:hypothetical protein
MQIKVGKRDFLVGWISQQGKTLSVRHYISIHTFELMNWCFCDEAIGARR